MQRKIISEVEINFNGTRLDLWLSSRFSYHSRNQWQNIISQGEILVNGSTAKPSKTLFSGDKVEFIINGYDEPPVNRNYEIVFEDNNILAVNKPSDLPCHPAGIYFKNTLVSILGEDLSRKLFLINRLDRETSGIVLFAKNLESSQYLSGLFASKKIYKEYIVAVHGLFPEKLHAAGYLASDTKSIIRKKRKFIYKKDIAEVNSAEEIEFAETYFERIKTHKGLSLVKVIPETGRLHQIRATLCSIKYPVVGDKIYGKDESLFLRFIDDKLTEKDLKTLILDHQALHARCIEFKSYGDNLDINIIAEPPTAILNLFQE